MERTITRTLVCSTSFYSLGLLAGVGAAALAAPAAAQEASARPAQSDDRGSSSSFDDIVVTARRTEERSQSVPVAITALTGEALAQKGIAKASDLMTAVPGVFSAPGSNRGSNTPVFAVRGQVAREPALTNDPSIALYFAEVPWANPGGSNSSFLDLKSVQVLKGPQGTLFGRNTTAGAILITPAAPTDKLEGYGKVALGTYDFKALEGVLNLPIATGVALRVAGNIQERNGFLYNVTGNQRLNDLGDHSLRVSLKLDPADNFTTTIIGTYFNSDTNGDGQRLIGIAPAAPSAGLAGVYAKLKDALTATNALPKYQVLSSFSPSVAAISVLGVPQVFQTQQRYLMKTWTAQANSSMELGQLGFLGNVTLKNIIGYRHQEDNSTFETASAPFLSVQSLSDNHANQFSEEFQIQGVTGNLSYIAGLFYFRQKGTDLAYSYAVAPITAIGQGDVTKTSRSAFAHLSYDFGDSGLALTAGIRYTADKQVLLNSNRRQTTPGPFSPSSPVFCALVTPTVAQSGANCGVRFEIQYERPTWDVGLNYKFANSLAYATISRGYRSGGFSEGAQSIAAAGTPFAPETVYNYEIGIKNDFHVGGMPVRLNLAGYYTDYSNIQRTVNFIGPSGLFNLTINAAKARILGAETDLTIKPARNLSLSASYSYVDPKYKSFTDQFRDPLSLIIYPVDVSDSRFVLVSKHSLNMSLNYDFPLRESAGALSLNASYYYRSNFYTTSDINTARCTVPGDPNASIYVNCYNHGGKLPGYGLANIRLDWRNVLGRKFDVAIFVNNVFDKYYFPNALNALGAFGSLSAQIGPPRMAGMEVKVPFGN